MRKVLKFAALSLFAALLLWWFGRNLDWAAVSTAIGRADWRLIALGVVFVWLTYLIRALRWRAFLKPLAPAVSLRETFAATSLGFSAIFLIGRAGEVVRPTYLPLRDERVRPSAAFVTIAVERIFDMVAVILMFAANLLFFRPAGADGSAAYGRVREAGLILLAGAVAGVVALAYLRRHTGAVTGWLERRLEGRQGVLLRAGKLLTGVLEQLSRALGVLVDARELLATAGWTAALWATIIVANMLVLRAFDLPVGVAGTIFVLGWSLVGSVVPTPGGAAGTYHAATAYALTAYLGVAETEAKAATIVLHLVVFGSALFFGVYYFLRGGVSLARMRELLTTGEAGAAGDDERAAGEAQAKRVPAVESPRGANA